MKILLLIFLSLDLSLCAQNYEQQDVKILTSKCRAGVYRTFKEFVTNNPSLDLDFTIELRTAAQIWAWGGTEYSIDFPDSKMSKKFIRDSIWGICKSDSMFINNRLVSTNKGFDWIGQLGYPLSYFVAYILMRDEDKEMARVAASFGAFGGAAAGTPYQRVVALNMKTGELIRLNEYGMQTLLKDDAALLEKYNTTKEDAEDDSFIFSILDEYNLKHK